MKKGNFWTNLVQKIKVISLTWNLEPSLTQICRIQLLCELFLFWTRNTLFGKTWSQNSKLFKVKFGTENNLNMKNLLKAFNARRISIFTFFLFVWKYPFWLREHRQKTFITISGLWPLRRWWWEVGEGEWGWVNPLRKEHFCRKSFFQLMLNEILKNCEKWYLLM